MCIQEGRPGQTERPAAQLMFQPAQRPVKHDSRATETPRLRDPSGILALLRIRIRIDFHFVTYIFTTQGADSAPEHIYWRGTGQ